MKVNLKEGSGETVSPFYFPIIYHLPAARCSSAVCIGVTNERLAFDSQNISAASSLGATYTVVFRENEVVPDHDIE